MEQFITVIICVIDFNVSGEELNKHHCFHTNPIDLCIIMYVLYTEFHSQRNSLFEL